MHRSVYNINSFLAGPPSIRNAAKGGSRVRVGIDFGTTNSSIAYYDGSALHRLTLDLASDNPYVLPSLVYINRDHQVSIGTRAAVEYLERETGRPVNWEKRGVGEIDIVAADMSYVQSVHVLVDTAAQGRLLQYVKTALRDPTYAGTRVFDRFYTIDELIAMILRPLKSQAEQTFGEPCPEAVIGCPVRFSEDAAITERAKEILYKAGRLAGFEDVRFELEPVGATYHYHRTAPTRQTAFIFDFGGGTLDLTIAEVGGRRSPRILATHGVLVGGDDLDKRLMQSLFKYFGGATAAAPKGTLPAYILELLDNWQTMPMLSRPYFAKLLDEFQRSAANNRPILALRTLVTQNLGFKLFREIERTKKRLSDEYGAPLKFQFGNIAIEEYITRRDFETMIRKESEEVERGVVETLAKAGLKPADVDVVLRTGGTSAVPIFTGLLARIFGEEKLIEMDLFTSVVGGLAVIAHERGGTETRYGLRYPSKPDDLVCDIQSVSRRPFGRYEFRIGARCLTECPHTLRRIPVELSGLPALRLPQADKDATMREYMQFHVTHPSRVYVAHDAKAQSVPEWLRAFSPHPGLITVNQYGTERSMRLFSKDFPEGRIALGGNRAPGQRGEVILNYLVVVQALF